MGPSTIFILRPVATTLLMLAILLVGLVAYHFLPLSALPEVDYPTIQVQTFYPGASPEVMTSSVTAPLERQFGEMPGLNQMASQSSAGASVITLQFTLDLSLDIAEQEVQAAINAAGNLLPSDLPAPPIYAKVNPADAPILTLALTSKTLPLTGMEDLAETRIAQKISQIAGVGLVSISGGHRPAVRVRADLRALAGVGLNIDDLRTTIGNLNVNTPKGNFDGPAQAYTVNANDQLTSADAFKTAIIAYRNNAPVHLTDVARLVQGSENNQLQAWVDRTPAVLLNVQRQPGANVIEVVDRITALLPRLQASLPAALSMTPVTNRTITIRASVADVEFELALSIALVVLVIFLFLRTLPATIIPSLSVPLSLVGTLAAMYLWGFSLDNLSLMALTIATGFVVDDAIVMIENISRYVEAGEPPLQAALKGAQQIGFTIISLTVSLLAVLIPLLFMGDVVGRLFHEFAITLAVTIVISAVVSLTLVPMMCARLLRHRPPREQSRFALAAERFTTQTIGAYARWLDWVLDRQFLTLIVAAGTVALTVGLYIVIPKGFFPVQDTGLIQGISSAAPSASYAAMSRLQQRLADAVLKDADVASLTSFIGVDGSNTTLNQGRFLINLRPRNERRATASDIIRRIQDEAAGIPGIQLFMQPVQDLSIDTTVSATQYQFVLENADLNAFATWVPRLMTRLQAIPDITDVASSMQANGLAADVTIDRATAGRFGITPATVDNALYDAFGQRIVLDHLHPVEPVSRHSRLQPWRPHRFAEPRRDLSAVIDSDERPGAAHFPGQGNDAHCAARGQPSRPVSRHHHQFQSLAGRVAWRRRQRHTRSRGRPAIARQFRHRVPGRRLRLRKLAEQRNLPGARRHCDDVHRAGRALREFRASRHHPVHPAVGRHRRAARPHARRIGSGYYRHHRHRVAHRHRQEERHHDDRFRPGGRARAGPFAARRHTGGLPAALPPHSHDHDGGAVFGTAAHAWHRHGL